MNNYTGLSLIIFVRLFQKSNSTFARLTGENWFVEQALNTVLSDKVPALPPSISLLKSFVSDVSSILIVQKQSHINCISAAFTDCISDLSVDRDDLVFIFPWCQINAFYFITVNCPGYL